MGQGVWTVVNGIGLVDVVKVKGYTFKVAKEVLAEKIKEEGVVNIQTLKVVGKIIQVIGIQIIFVLTVYVLHVRERVRIDNGISKGVGNSDVDINGVMVDVTTVEMTEENYRLEKV